MTSIPRLAAAVLAVLLAAVAIGSGAYGLVLAIGRDPVPQVEERVAMPAIRRPDPPAPLPSAPEFRRRARSADVAVPPEQVELQVVVPPLPAWLGEQPAGVAIYRADTGAEFQWLPLATAEHNAAGAAVVRAHAKRNQRLSITLAAAPGYARHGYLERREASVPPDAHEPMRIQFDAAIAVVRLDLPADAERAGPLRLQRCDDPEWLPMLHDRPGLTLQRGTTTTLLLGRGAYRLCDALDPLRCQQFEVSGDTAVVLSPDLLRARGDRP